MEQITIRKAEVRDLEEIAALEARIFTDPWSKTILRISLINPITLFLVAEEAEGIAGYIVVQEIAGEANLNNIAVRETARGRGIGSALMTAAIDWAKSTGCELVTLEVRISNLNARRLYERLGFEYLGDRPGYYESPNEDAAIYTLLLNKEETE